MPQPPAPRWSDGVSRWGRFRWQPAAAAPAPLLSALTPIQLNTYTAMEYWELTKQRAQETLPVWTQYVPALTIATTALAGFTTLIEGFEPLVQARTLAQDDADAGFRTVQDALLRMKALGTRVPAIIEGQLDEDAPLMMDVDDLYATPPRNEGTILKRLRELYPVWVRADAALAAMTPAQPAIARKVGGTLYTAAAAKALLDSYTNLVKTMKDTEELLDMKRAALRAHDRQVDRLNKRWYKVVKASAEPESEVYEALGGITTESGTSAPETIEIGNVSQGGEEGRQALVSYVPGGGARATSRLVRWQLVGVDADFAHSEPLDPSGNALGPFTVGQVVKILTEVSNSSGSRTTAPRSIAIAEPVV